MNIIDTYFRMEEVLRYFLSNFVVKYFQSRFGSYILAIWILFASNQAGLL